MLNKCICAPARIYKVVVVGLKTCQLNALKEILREYPIAVRDISPATLLRLRRLNDLVVLTRFVNHKHSQHAKQITSQDVIWVSHGAARAAADAIVSFFDLNNRAG
jgi:hypothetical protein